MASIRARAVALASPLLLASSQAALAAAPPVAVSFAAPAGSRPAGPLLGAPFAAVLPSGALIDPAGRSTVVGTNALGFAMTPDGRFAVVANGSGDPGGHSLAVVDTRSMAVVTRMTATEPFFGGVVALRDPRSARNMLVLASAGAANRVLVFDLDRRGRLKADRTPAIEIPPPLDERFADFGWAAPSTIVVAPGGRSAFVVNRGRGDVATIDITKRTVSGSPSAVGYAPFAAALTRGALLVANEGVARVDALGTPAHDTAFGGPRFDDPLASSLTAEPFSRAAFMNGAHTVPLESQETEGTPVGGVQPSAVVASSSAPYAFVTLGGVDKIVTLWMGGIGGVPRAVGTTDLRLYPGAPYGTQPSALALSRDGRRLYVALAGINAIAVMDARNPQHLRRLGLLPAGWMPSALTLSRDARRLFVLNARGTLDAAGNAVATLQRIDLSHAPIAALTRRTLACARAIAAAGTDPVTPRVLGGARSAAIRHVVLVLAGNRTFDAMFGDLAGVDARYAAVAQPALARYGAALTPNLHALARTFALAANLYNDAISAQDGDVLALAGAQSLGRARSIAGGIRSAAESPVAPDAWPRMGLLYDALAARGLRFRDDGVFVDRHARGALGSVVAIPLPRVLEGNAAAGSDVDFASVRLPFDAARPEADAIADQDRALGALVQTRSHAPEWASTALFIVPEVAAASTDHVDPRRSYAIVVSPFARRGYVGLHHLSTASVLKTEEELLGVPALSLADALSTDLSDFFTPAANATAFTAIGVPPGPRQSRGE